MRDAAEFAGHGNLFHRFLSPHPSRRDDQDGGGWEGRVRIVTDRVTALCVACGTDFIIGLELAGDDGLPGGIGPNEA